MPIKRLSTMSELDDAATDSAIVLFERGMPTWLVQQTQEEIRKKFGLSDDYEVDAQAIAEEASGAAGHERDRIESEHPTLR